MQLYIELGFFQMI